METFTAVSAMRSLPAIQFRFSRRRPAHRPPNRCAPGFTLIELLTVIGIISVLVSLLLPSLAGVKRQTRETQCLNNFRQIGVMTRLYSDDFADRFPPGSVRDWDPVNQSFTRKPASTALGGIDPAPGHFAEYFPYATNRPLARYQGRPEVFHCPSDKGHLAFPSYPICTDHDAKPTMWETIGCSYRYNAGVGAPEDSSRSPPLPIATLLPRGPGLPRLRDTQVFQPERHLLMTEPAARPIGRAMSPTTVIFFWSQWHRNRGRTDFRDPTIAPALFYSPALFVDGHAAVHDFSRAVMTDLHYPYEETRDWIWYQPRQ